MLRTQYLIDGYDLCVLLSYGVGPPEVAVKLADINVVSARYIES